MLDNYAALPAEQVKSLHPGHTPASIAALRLRFRPFEQGHCIVHHLFGAEVVAQVRRDHSQAFLTAHLEVPGEMFALASEAQLQGRGAVGSTSNLLDFILAQVKIAAPASTLEFVLGTEAGMITSIVRAVQRLLAERGDGVAVDIVFPVAADAVAVTGDSALPLVPGPAAGEGCSTAGGCATCPYMKMNHLDGLIDVLQSLALGQPQNLAGLAPRMDRLLPGGGDAVALGSVPILHMRAFQRTGRLPQALVDDILGRGVP
jgi:quinolinate synthase